MAKEEYQKIFAMIDRDNSGSIDFDEFLEKLRPPMSEQRLAIIESAFK